MEGPNLFTVTLIEDQQITAVYKVNIYRIPAVLSIQPSSQTVTVDGIEKVLSAYNINGSNFLQLRDVAMLLKDTSKAFAVSYDADTSAAGIHTGNAYFPNGTENAAAGDFHHAVISSQIFTLDGEQIFPMAYNIDGSNYLLLRDAAALLDLCITYVPTENRIAISTMMGYSASN